MKYLYFLSLMIFLLALGCTRNIEKSGMAARMPAQQEIPDELDQEKILKYMQLVLKLNKEPKNKKFYAINFPIIGGSDIRPTGIEEYFRRLYQNNPELETTSLLLYPIERKQQISWKDFMDEKDKLRNILTLNLTRPERDELLAICSSYAVNVGDEIPTLSSPGIAAYCSYSGLLHTEAEVKTALEQFPNLPKGVRYDGQRGFHVYTNRSLERQVQILTAAINTHLHRFYELFMAQPDAIKEKFRINKDGTNEVDKVEPFDLLSTYTTYLIMGKSMGTDRETLTNLNKIQVSKIAQKALARVFHMKSENNVEMKSLPNMVISRSENTLLVMCAEGLPEVAPSKKVAEFEWRRTESGTNLLETWKPEFNLDQMFRNNITKSSISCNDVNYEFHFENLDTEPIPPPNPLVVANEQPLNALMTVSLVGEIDRSAIDQARQMVKLFTGWEVIGPISSVKTKVFLENELVKADAYFPVMHAMDVNYFNIGSENGFAIHLRKVVALPSGTKREINLKILMPDKNNNFNHVIMKPKDLAKLIHQRFINKPTSLFLMNNSCSSEKTLFAWTLVFREALELRKESPDFKGISAVKDFPYIIGSKRYFGTDDVTQIFSHSEFPLKSLEMLGEGKSVLEIIDFLKKPHETSFIQNLTSLFNSKIKEDTNSFEPVSIFDHPEILKLGGIRITIKAPTIQGQDQY